MDKIRESMKTEEYEKHCTTQEFQNLLQLQLPT